MKSHLLLLALVLGMSSCAGSGGTVEQGSKGAGSTSEQIRLAPEDVVAFEADRISADAWSGAAYFAEFKVDRTFLEEVLANWHRVSAYHWDHGYSHVAGGDRFGTMTLRDGRLVRWMMRPGGLATLSFPDGTVRHLARELTDFGVEAKTSDATAKLPSAADQPHRCTGR